MTSKSINKGLQLKLAREYRGYSQAQLCKSIEGLSHSRLSKFERGFEGVISDEKIAEIMGLLKWPVTWLERPHPQPYIAHQF